MLILDSPKTNILLAAGDQFVSLNRTKLDCQYVEIAKLFSEEGRFTTDFNITDVEDEHSLPFVCVQTNHSQLFLAAQSNLLHLFIWALEAAYALVINPNAYRALAALLHRYKPVLVRIHSHNIICVSLHEHLFSSVYVSSHENAACRIVHFIILKNHIRVVQRTERKRSR